MHAISDSDEVLIYAGMVLQCVASNLGHLNNFTDFLSVAGLNADELDLI